MTSRPSRRLVLSLTGAILTGSVSGCLSAGENTDTPERDRTTQPSTDAPESDTPSSSTPEETEVDSGETEVDSVPEPRDVSFTPSSGATVEATLYRDGPCGVVLVPQVNRDRESWRPQAERLVEEGYVALPIDEGSDPPAAVLGAVEYLRAEHGISRAVALGASTGGEAVLTAAAAEPDRIDGVVALSAAGGVAQANRLTGEKLFGVSRNGESRFVDIATEAAERASDPKQLNVYDGDAHGQQLFESPHQTELWDAIFTLTTTACQNE